MQLLRLGDQGPAVAEIRGMLAGLGMLGPDVSSAFGLGADASGASFDAALDGATRAFQQQRGLRVDGVVGATTYRALKEASYHLGSRSLRYQVTAPLYGDDVAELQRRLQELGFYLERIDGFFGPATHESLKSFQREIGIASDGICGSATLRALDLIGTRVSGGSPHAITEEELVRRSGPQLTGKRLVIDPGLGGTERGLIVDGRYGQISESELLWDMASRLEGRMTATGMDTYLSHPRTADPTEAQRAARANSLDADVTISLRCDRSPSPYANGVATFHFGNAQGSVSMIGQALAGLIQREIVARTPLLDCRTHGRTWDLLRLTKMPTVQIDLGYLSNTGDIAILSDPRMRDSIAEAILVSVKRLYLLGQDDQPTGTYSFKQLLEQELSAAE